MIRNNNPSTYSIWAKYVKGINMASTKFLFLPFWLPNQATKSASFLKIAEANKNVASWFSIQGFNQFHTLKKITQTGCCSLLIPTHYIPFIPNYVFHYWQPRSQALDFQASTTGKSIALQALIASDSYRWVVYLRQQGEDSMFLDLLKDLSS